MQIIISLELAELTMCFDKIACFSAKTSTKFFTAHIRGIQLNNRPT